MEKEKKVWNATQHSATTDQREAGVVEPEVWVKEEIKSLLTFDFLPTFDEVDRKSEAIAEIAEENIPKGVRKVMIGGAPFLMAPLEKALRKRGLKPVYAFSRRESVEKEENGKVTKIQVFKHLGFVEA